MHTSASPTLAAGHDKKRNTVAEREDDADPAGQYGKTRISAALGPPGDHLASDAVEAKGARRYLSKRNVLFGRHIDSRLGTDSFSDSHPDEPGATYPR